MIKVKLTNNFLVFLLIGLSLAVVLIRFTSLADYPVSLFSDEVDAAYQAENFNRCFTDYFGNRFPTHFQSFADWRTPLNIYAISLSQKIFGISDPSVRLPSVVFGLIFSLLLALLVYQAGYSGSTALLAFFLALINPWSFHYSRTGFEVMGMLVCLLSGLLFLFKHQTSSKSFHLFISIFSFALSIYFYSTAKLFLFIITPILLIVFWPSVKKFSLTSWLLLIGISLLLLSPYLYDTYQGRSGFRFSYISIFSDPTVAKTVDYLRFQDAVIVNGEKLGLSPSLVSTFSHNKLQSWFQTFITNYFSSFSTDFLFLTGDSNVRHGFGSHGLLYFPDLFFVIIGIASIRGLKSRQRQLSWVFLSFLLLAPIPFALTRDSLGPHATRLILMLPSLLYFSLIGISTTISTLHQNLSFPRFFSLIICIAVYLFSFFNFYHFYTTHYSYISARSWHMGMKDTVLSAVSLPAKRFYFSSKGESFIPFFLYYTNYSPSSSPCAPATSLVWDNNSFFTGMQTENRYYFGHIDWPQLATSPETLSATVFVTVKSEYDQITSFSKTLIKEIKHPTLDTESFVIFTLNQ